MKRPRDARSLWQAAAAEAAAWAVGEERQSSGVFLRGVVAGALIGAAIAGSSLLRRRTAPQPEPEGRDSAGR